MELVFTLVDEAGNAGSQIAIKRGETKTVCFYPKLKNGAPWSAPYSATDIEVAVQGGVMKNFSSGVGWLGAYMGFFAAFTAADTAAMPIPKLGAPVNVSIKITLPTGVEIADIPGAFLVTDPMVAV